MTSTRPIPLDGGSVRLHRHLTVETRGAVLYPDGVNTAILTVVVIVRGAAHERELGTTKDAIDADAWTIQAGALKAAALKDIDVEASVAVGYPVSRSKPYRPDPADAPEPEEVAATVFAEWSQVIGRAIYEAEVDDEAAMEADRHRR